MWYMMCLWVVFSRKLTMLDNIAFDGRPHGWCNPRACQARLWTPVQSWPGASPEGMHGRDRGPISQTVFGIKIQTLYNYMLFFCIKIRIPPGHKLTKSTITQNNRELWITDFDLWDHDPLQTPSVYHFLQNHSGYDSDKLIRPSKICMTQSKLMLLGSVYVTQPGLSKSKHQISFVEVLIVKNCQC